MEEELGRSGTTHAWYIVSGAILAGILVRFIGVGVQSLWVDEAMTLDNSYIGYSLNMDKLFHNLQGPLISLLMHFWSKILMTDGFLRLPFAVVGALTVLAAYRLARYLMDSWRTLHTVLFIAMSPLLLWYSLEIRGYAFVLLFTVLMTYYLVKWLEQPTQRSLAIYGACFLGGLLSNLSAAFVGLAHFIYLLSRPRRRGLVGRWLVAVLVVMLFFAPWIRSMVTNVKPQTILMGTNRPSPSGGAEVTPLVIPYVLFVYSVGYTLGPSTRELKSDPGQAIRGNLPWISVAAVFFAIPVLTGMASMIRNRPNLAFLLMLWFVVPIVAAVGLSLLRVRVFTPRYTLVALPAYAFFFGEGLAGARRKHYWVLLAAALALWSVSIFNYWGNEKYAKDDARSAARVIETGYTPGDSILAFYAVEPLAHYLRGFAPVSVFTADDIVSPEAMIARCQEVASKARRVWLYLSREEVFDREHCISNWFRNNMRYVSSRSFPGVKLYLYEKVGQEP